MLKGTVLIPADKSISQRALILSTLACGSFEVFNFSDSLDAQSTMNVVRGLGVEVEFLSDNHLKICNSGLVKPKDMLNCFNSGTCMRMMSGVLAGCGFDSVLIGDESLSTRPMRRVIEPLSLMGARIKSDGGVAPLKIYGRELTGVSYKSQIASAQVKSCVLLAGVQAQGETCYYEPFRSRNHTEIMLKNMGADIKIDEAVRVRKSTLTPVDIRVVGDFSSAAFFIAAGLVVPDSNIVIKNVGLNPTRIGFLEIVKSMGADVEIIDYNENNSEPFGDLRVKYSELNGVKVGKELVANAIDELPLLALLGACANGKTIVKDAQELRKKESDRIHAVVSQFKKLGVEIEETEDGFVVEGKQQIIGGVELESFNDHRIAMCLYIAGLIAQKSISIKGFECVNISFPRFEELINLLQRPHFRRK